MKNTHKLRNAVILKIFLIMHLLKFLLYILCFYKMWSSDIYWEKEQTSNNLITLVQIFVCVKLIALLQLKKMKKKIAHQTKNVKYIFTSEFNGLNASIFTILISVFSKLKCENEKEFNKKFLSISLSPFLYIYIYILIFFLFFVVGSLIKDFSMHGYVWRKKEHYYYY